jgi:hypothetical protein
MTSTEIEEMLERLKSNFTLDWLARRLKAVYSPEEISLLIERLEV